MHGERANEALERAGKYLVKTKLTEAEKTEAMVALKFSRKATLIDDEKGGGKKEI